MFVVWEPVIATDVAPPTTGTLQRVHDLRAVQFWDHDRVLSAEIVKSVLAAPERYSLADPVYSDSIVWDAVAVFPPHGRWERNWPVPTYYGFPVVEAAGGLNEALARARAPGSDPPIP